ncbi:unnamed protein product [Trichogramma brassicae]|uniref:Exocyst complex component Sec3 PIP2-binding N-terminal domain-containing protein n=1 Tax=Trichogramma brassicae TaxID=86971 RepID=A0A6H5HVM0_9HYME|nr:unnamed protein product [Trichogramma brassicae]
MAATRHTLQREIFSLSDEKLLSICHVSKAYKKKKTSFLCLVSTMDIPETHVVYQVKRSSEKSALKKKQSWLLSDIHTVDGINVDSMDLEIHADKIYKWTATNPQERQNFISNLYFFSFGLPQRPDFKNIPKECMTTELSSVASTDNNSNGISADFLQSPMTASEYQPITTNKETKDLSSLMVNCYYAISNAELFMETLSKDLSVLDGENIQSVLASEPQVSQLMNDIEVAIEEATTVESQLIIYDEALGNIREAMERVGQKNQAIHLANRNARQLLEQLELVITQLTISPEHVQILNEAELPGHKDELAIAGSELLRAVSFQLPLGLDKLSAVSEQRKKLDKLRVKFSLLVARHLNNLFIHLGNDIAESASTPGNAMSTSFSSSASGTKKDFNLSSHESIQKELEPYTELMKLLRVLDSKAFVQLTKVYTKTMSTLYQRNFKTFFEDAKDSLIVGHFQQQQTHPSSKPGNSANAKGDIEAFAALTPPLCLLGNEQWSPQGEGTLLDSVLDNVLSQLQPLCLAEQAFCVKFLHLDSFLSPTTKTSQQPIRDETGSCSSGYSGVEDLCNILTTSSGSTDSTQLSRLERQVNEQVRATMSAIFPSLETELNSLISFLEKIDSLHRRKLLKWVSNIKDGIFRIIGTLNNHFVIVENFHHLHDSLARLKISVLDHERKEAKQKYQEALKAYVTRYFGRPLEKLNFFFDGVQAKVGAGVKESEISYQMAFSRQELRRVVKEYPAREVKKGLEHLYKKVEKHLCEEENLLQVVWREMQGEFIAQYTNIEKLIQRCYPDSNVTLEFTIENILEFFSEIAQSH